MPVTSLDHIHVETRDWDAGVAFWRGNGFAFTETWGGEGHRAGKLVAGEATVVLAEIDGGEQPEFDIFFKLEEADDFEMASTVEVDQALDGTHWGTRRIRVRDPEGRIFCLDETPEE
jgi:hypothetical protein